jgi:integrase
VFFAVLVSAVIPGAVVGRVARWLGLGLGERPMPPAVLELTSTQNLTGGEIVSFSIDGSSAVCGSALGELPLPADCAVLLLVRDNRVIPRRKPPHIYSDAEIAQLLRAAAGLRPRGGLRPQTYVTLFSLLACTGLRVSEAHNLTIRDVDLGASLLVIRETKFRKSRLVPLHPSAVTALARYAAFRDRYANFSRSEYFFRTDHAASLRKRAVEGTFDKLRTRLYWTVQGRARRPRIHDLRHTFAVRRLLRWYEEGADVDQKILALSTYLGHAKVTDTYWYLSAIPELLAITARRFELYARRAGEEVQ